VAQVPQLIELGGGQGARSPRLERPQAQRAELDAAQTHHRVAEGLAVALHLAVAPFA